MEKRRPPWIPVVAGLMKREGRVLLGQRPAGDVFPGLWEFPGGKLEEGEPPVQALTRELREELQVEAKVGSLRLAITHHSRGINLIVLFYDIVSWKGEPQPAHHGELQWTDFSKLPHLKVPEANKIHLNEIMEVLDS